MLRDYEVEECIGKGSFGTVSRIRRKRDGRVLVWKEVSYGGMCEKEKKLIVSEVNILRELKHPHIVRYYDRIVDQKAATLYIVMEHCEGGDLSRLISRHRRAKQPIPEERIWKWAAQLVCGLKKCHNHRSGGSSGSSSGSSGGVHGGGGGSGSSSSAGSTVVRIMHRDIKPANILMDRHQNVKLGDFGLARELGVGVSQMAKTHVGTPTYMSPEMINEIGYNEASDIWALGCLLYELAALCPPFEAKTKIALALKINAGQIRRIPSAYSDDLQRTIRWMLSPDVSVAFDQQGFGLLILVVHDFFR